MTEETIKEICYTKEEVDLMIEAALAEARAIDEASMRNHNRDATIISMILGFTCLALFDDGLYNKALNCENTILIPEFKLSIIKK